MTVEKTYNCFSEKGQTELPVAEEILSAIQSGVEPTIFLDSCVCLHIIKVVDYGKRATNIDLSKVLSLKKYLHDNQIKLSPFFGLLELCWKNGNFDFSKFKDFKYRIDFFRQIPLKVFRSFRYDFNRDYYILKDIPSDLDYPNDLVEPPLINSYCALLKMRSLAKNGLSKETAEENIYSFLDWMVNVLDSVRAAEYRLALNVFGGNSAYRKMIGLDCKASEVKKKLNGTSWDIFHARTTSNGFLVSKMLGENIKPYFLTSDTNLFNLFKDINLSVIKDGGKEINSSFVIDSSFTYPHFNENFIDAQNRKMLNIFIDRRNTVYKFDKPKVQRLIGELELENEIL